MATMITAHPPAAFDLDWTVRRPLRDGRTLYVAAGDTPVFTEAYKLARTELRHLGYSMLEARAEDPWTGYRPAFWMTENGWSLEALAFYRDEVIPKERVKAAAEAKRKEEDRRYWEERRAKEANLVADARAAAEESLRDRHWAWARREAVDEARALLARQDLTKAEAKRLAALAANADATVARAAEASATALPEELTLASDPAVREGCLHAVRYVTVLDGDRATVENGEGWGRTTTVLGHVLAGLEELSEAQATHALRILRVHRRQLPPALDAAVFQGVPLGICHISPMGMPLSASQASLPL